MSLAAGAEAVVTIPLTPRDLSIWDVVTHSWQVVRVRARERMH